jgi:hypothetical protein
METSADSMTAPWWRHGWSMLDRLLAELVSLKPASAVLFRSLAAEEVAQDAAEDVVSAPRAA